MAGTYIALEGKYANYGEQRHHTRQRFDRNPHYSGPCTIWDEEEARYILGQLLDYFSCEMLPPPYGLPGRNDEIDSDAMELLGLGYGYFRALADGRTGRQWSYYEDASRILRETYAQGKKDELERIIAQDTARALEQLNGAVDRPDTSLVYFIASERGPIKIGKAIDPVKRLKALQTSHHDRLEIVATCAGGREQEAVYHQQFGASRLHGEWFERTPELLAEIARLNVSPTLSRTTGDVL